MATVNITNPIRANNAGATSAQDAYLPSVNAGYGPHSSLAVAQQQLNTIFNNNIPLGVTVGIKSGSAIVEYWNPASANTFVIKSSGGGRANVYIASDIVEDTTTVLNTLYPTASAGDIVVNSSNGSVYICYEAGSWVKVGGTILRDTAPITVTITEANILSYK